MAQKFNLYSYKGTDKISFGESRENTRRIFGEYEEYRKNNFSKNTSDDFREFHVFYDSEDNVEAIEFFDSELFINNKKIFPNNKSDLIKILTELGAKGSESADSIVSSLLGISVYIPDGQPKSLLIYKKGYFN